MGTFLGGQATFTYTKSRPSAIFVHWCLGRKVFARSANRRVGVISSKQFSSTSGKRGASSWNCWPHLGDRGSRCRSPPDPAWPISIFLPRNVDDPLTSERERDGYQAQLPLHHYSRSTLPDNTRYLSDRAWHCRVCPMARWAKAHHGANSDPPARAL